MKTGLIDNHLSKAENSVSHTTCDPKKDEIVEFLKRSLLVQHHAELNELLQPRYE